jgi:cytochrome c peroxidase
MNWKATGVFTCALFGLWLGVSIAVEAVPERKAALQAYRPPGRIPAPADNPHTAAKARLGRSLFFDPILSGSGARSCASCHNPGLSWADGLSRAVGEGQSSMALRSPTLLAIAWVDRLGWDGKFRDLESVAFAPITSKANMNLSEQALIERLGTIPGYRQAFAAAFHDGAISRRNIELALATFERTIVPGTTPFIRWVEGDERAIGAAAKRGFALFNGKARCAKCHEGYAFTNGAFHDIGTARGDDVGRGRLFPNSVQLQYAFKTPTLWDAARRSPYMHDGSVPTLEAVIDLYDRGGIDRPSRSPLIAPLRLTLQEKSDLIAFLHTLTSETETFELPTMPR